MFGVSRQADYGVRAMLDLAALPAGTVTSAGAIAGRQGVPPAFLAKILTRLRHAGLVELRRGIHGGAALARPPASIALLEVVEALDSAMEISRCVGDPRRCPLAPRCRVRGVWCRVQAVLRGSLTSVTLDQLLPS